MRLTRSSVAGKPVLCFLWLKVISCYSLLVSSNRMHQVIGERRCNTDIRNSCRDQPTKKYIRYPPNAKIRHWWRLPDDNDHLEPYEFSEDWYDTNCNGGSDGRHYIDENKLHGPAVTMKMTHACL
jgi:hypothetical protein